MREEFNLDSVLFYCKAFRKRLEHSRSKEKHSTTSRVSPYTAATLLAILCTLTATG